MISINERVYVRKLNANELGFRNGKVGDARGPAILISKNISNFFPPLSENIFNDSQPISLCVENTNKSVLLNFIYFNGKKVYNQPNGRDEKRIYISKDHYDFFCPGDFYLFYKIKTATDIYFLVKRVVHDEPNYVAIKNLSKDYKLDNLGNHLEVPKTVLDSIVGQPNISEPIEDEIDERVLNALNTKNSAENSFTSGSTSVRRARPRIDLEEDDDLELFENSSFRKLVLFFYGQECAISDNNIRYKKSINLEAAHIHWHAEGGTSHPTNGIPLCRDLHWAFDRGMFTIEYENENYVVKLHDKMKDCSYLSCFDGQQLKMPHDPRYVPKQEHLIWHQNNIYGNFLR